MCASHLSSQGRSHARGRWRTGPSVRHLAERMATDPRTGLGIVTDDDVALALRSDYPLSSTAIWTRNTGKLELTVESGSIFVAGHDYTFNFTVVNQARAQCAVSPSIQTCMDACDDVEEDLKECEWVRQVIMAT